MSTKRTKTNTKAQEHQDEGQSLFRQIMGAVLGGSLALGLYYAYELSTPVVTAWLTVPQSVEGMAENDANAADTDLELDQTNRIASRTKQILEQFGWHDSAPEAGDQPIALTRAEVRRAAAGVSTTKEGSTTDEMATPLADSDALQYEESLSPSIEDDGNDEAWPRHLEPIAPEQVKTSSEPSEWRGREESDHVVATKSEALPNSGIGLWLTGTTALGIASGMRYARRKKVA